MHYIYLSDLWPDFGAVTPVPRSIQPNRHKVARG